VERGAITDETLEAMLELWRSDEPSFQGRYFQIDGLAFEPKPVQRPRPPIYVGGNSKPALRRAARFEGWEPNPTEFSAEEMPPLIEYIRAQPDFAGKEETFEISWVGTLPGIAAGLRRSQRWRAGRLCGPPHRAAGLRARSGRHHRVGCAAHHPIGGGLSGLRQVVRPRGDRQSRIIPPATGRRDLRLFDCQEFWSASGSPRTSLRVKRQGPPSARRYQSRHRPQPASPRLLSKSQ
jgi:Luciferase-like monooxygenase